MKPSLRAALAAPLALLAAFALAGPVTAPAASAAKPVRSAAKPALAPASTPTAWGLASPGLPHDFTSLDATDTELGRTPDLVTWYVQWCWNSDFDATAAARVAAMGATPVITWEPWDPTQGVDQPAYSLAAIAKGGFDGYLKTWAREIKSYGRPVILRPMHEMNGDWYPWGTGVNGNTAADYVAAWRHIVGVFSAAKVTNVQWEWSPNTEAGASGALGQLYPGDKYVSLVAVDGYNWGTSQSWSTWQSFGQIFAKTVADLGAITGRPLYVAEVGSVEDGGDKAAWVSDMFAWLALHPEVKGVTWFNFDSGHDYLVDSSAGSLAAFRTGLASLG